MYLEDYNVILGTFNEVHGYELGIRKTLFLNIKIQKAQKERSWGQES